MRLLLIRHGESILGAAGRYAGHSNTPLSVKGRRQARALRRKLARFRVDIVFSSDLARCRETARLLGFEPKVTRRLREASFGAWEGLTGAECARRDRTRYARWLESPARVRPPGGESLSELATRVRRFQREIARRHPGKTVLLVAHAGPIRVMLERNLASFWKRRVPPASVHVIRRG